MEHGADKDKARDTGASPLYIAAEQGHLAVVQYLLEHGADKDKATNEGGTPIYMAAQNGYLAVVQCLLEQRAAIDRASNEGATPLFIAAQNGHLCQGWLDAFAVCSFERTLPSGPISTGARSGQIQG